MNTKKRKGVTLLELMIALAILTVSSMPIMHMIGTSVRVNAEAHRATMASLAATSGMEYLIGRQWAGDLNGFFNSAGVNTSFVSHGNMNFRIVSTVQAYYAPSIGWVSGRPVAGWDGALIRVQVSAENSGTTVSHVNVLNVLAGGIPQ